MERYQLILYCALLVIAIFHPACGSVGDRLERYQSLLSQCVANCREATIPWSISIFGWDCLDNCKYLSMHQVVDELIEYNQPIPQWHGKWPFVRFLGIQEPASVVFSIGNAMANYFGWKVYRESVHSNYRMYHVVRTYTMVSVNAWLWSTIFHTRDLLWTERMDYFSAGAVIAFGHYLFMFYILTNYGYKWLARLYGGIVLLLYSCHIYYMAFIQFSYSYNMRANVAVGFLTALCWCTWFIKTAKSRPHVWIGFLCAIGTPAVAALELFDFPPFWWTFDAHSLWHAATIPFAYIWFLFLRSDAELEIRRDQGKLE
ncbi:Post-GPI attachment to proteins factor 3 [Trichoplax sp. H2]|nr:Post-GPI attachment to proteins factor 3 [Trichoplax sp. H2]|eukprot:RDD43549.1 Post-GPI attachment to proteins factor 3 [Trichoplax sp. H2]